MEMPDDEECFPREFDDDNNEDSEKPKAKKSFEDDLDGVDEDEDQPLEDLMALIESENKDEDEDQMKPVGVKGIKKDEKAKETPNKPKGDLIKKKSTTTPAPKPNKQPMDKENFLTEKHTGIRLIKSSFSSDMELHTRVAADFGRYYKLTDLWKRVEDLKAQKDLQWFTIGIMGSKSEPKTSAKGNSYIIWNMYDVSHLEAGRDVSLFLFGNSYKKFWKSSEFEVFIIKKPDFMDDLKNSGGAGDKKLNKNNKARDSAKKISISIRNDSQLELLGVAKDLSYCQAFKRGQGETPAEREAGQRCKNLVNVSETKFCIFHCKQVSKEGGGGTGGAKGRFTMDGTKMKAAYGEKAASAPFPKFGDSPFSVGKIMTSSVPKVDKKALQQEALLSLSGMQYESKMLAQVAFKQQKANDRELLAKLANENIDEDELKKLRLMPKDHNEDATKSQKQIKSLFNSKLLLPSKANSSSVNVHRLIEMKDSAKSGDGGLTATQFVRVNEKYQNDRKNSSLSTMSSHRDIVNKLKKKAESASSDSNDAPESEKEAEKKKEEIAPVVRKEPKINVADFLKQTVSELSSVKKVVDKPKISKPSGDDFGLDIFDGEEKTTKKLMDVSAPLLKKIEFLNARKASQSVVADSSPKAAIPTKRKLDEVASSPNTSFKEEKEKKMKLIDELIGIKSNYDKDANDPAKNAHLKSYLDRLEQKEQVDNKLASIRTQEVKVVTCAICSYTYFSQSEFCRNKKHEVKWHTAVQRYFKCKVCNKRTFTLNKLCPNNSCDQCGSDKYEACHMRDENIAKNTESKLSVYGD